MSQSAVIHATESSFLDQVLRSDLGRRLGGGAVHAHVTAVAQLRGERAGLDEANRAQPAIDAGLLGLGSRGHAPSGAAPEIDDPDQDGGSLAGNDCSD